MIKHSKGEWKSEWGVGVLEVSDAEGYSVCDLECFCGDSEIEDGNIKLVTSAPTAPHECDDPTCPGNINRQKLAMWEEMVEALDCARIAACTVGAQHKGEYEIPKEAVSIINEVLTKAEAMSQKEK